MSINLLSPFLINTLLSNLVLRRVSGITFIIYVIMYLSLFFLFFFFFFFIIIVSLEIVQLFIFILYGIYSKWQFVKIKKKKKDIVVFFKYV